MSSLTPLLMCANIHLEPRKEVYVGWYRSQATAQAKRLAISDRKGAESEKRIEKILWKLMVKGVIRYYIKTERYDPADRSGIDFIICVEPHLRPLYLQVKSSLEKRNDHLSMFPNIPCIAVLSFQDDEELTTILLHELKIALPGLA